MDYGFTFRLSTDRPLTCGQVAHIRDTIAGEIMGCLGGGILNAPDEDDESPAVRLVGVAPGPVSEHFHDGTSVVVEVPADGPPARI